MQLHALLNLNTLDK